MSDLDDVLEDDTADSEETMSHLLHAIRHLMYAATNQRVIAIAVTAAALAEYCGRDVPIESRQKHLDQAIRIIHKIWETADRRAVGEDTPAPTSPLM